MGLLNSIKDHFTNAEFSVAPQMKVKSICKNFKETFGCTLAIYKGAQLTDPEMTLKQLNEKTSKDIKTGSFEEIKIKGSMKVGDAEKLFDKEVEIQNVTNELAKKSNSAVKNTKLANELSELRKEKRKLEELVFDDENIIIEKQRSLRLSQRSIVRELARFTNKNDEISQQIKSLGKVSSKSFQDINQTADNPFSVFVELSK